MAKSQEKHNFEARIWSSRHDGFVELSVWDNGLTPLNYMDGCSIREWVRGHIDDLWDDKELRDRFEIPADWENYEVVFSGVINGYWSYGMEGSEWEEDIDIVGTPVMQKLPDNLIFPTIDHVWIQSRNDYYTAVKDEEQRHQDRLTELDGKLVELQASCRHEKKITERTTDSTTDVCYICGKILAIKTE